ETFARVGAVESASVVTDRDTGRSRGFGFVEMATAEEANDAVARLNGTELDGRRIKGELAKPGGGAGGGAGGGPGRSRGGGGGGGGRRGGGGGGGRAPGSPSASPRTRGETRPAAGTSLRGGRLPRSPEPGKGEVAWTAPAVPAVARCLDELCASRRGICLHGP